MAPKKQPEKKEPAGEGVDITNSNRADESLQASEERFRLIINNSRDIIFTMNIEGEFIFVSPAVKDALGYDPGELVGRAFQSLIHPDDIAATEEALRKNIEKGERSPNIEYRVKDKYGNWHWYTTSGSIVLNASGAFLNFLGISRDITERKQLEEELRDSEAKFRNIIEHSGDMFYMFDLDARPLYLSPRAIDMLGYTVDEFFQIKWTDHLTDSPVNRAALASTMAAVMTGQKQPPYPIEFKRKDGARLSAEINESPLKDPDGKVTGLVGVMRDISERKKTEEALKASEEKFRSIAEQSADVVWTTDETGTITFLSPETLNLFGYEPEEMVGRNFTEFLTPESIEEAMGAFAQTFSGQVEGGIVELKMKRKDGSQFLGELRGGLLKYGNTREAAGIILDITGRRQVEQALRESEEQFRAALENAPDGVYMNDLEGNFLYGNRRCEEIIGHRREELIGKNFLELNILPNNSLTRAAEILRDNINGKSTGPDELELISKDGRRVPVEINTSIIQRAGEKVVLAFVRDITERREAEEALRGSEERFRNMANLLPQTVFETDEKSNFVFVNRQGFEMFGYNEADIAAGMSVLEAIIPQDRDRAAENISLRIRGKESPPQEYTAVRKDGSKFPATIYAAPIIVNSRYAGMRGMLIDITESKIMENALKEKEAQYRLLAEHMTDTVWLMDMQLKATYQSPSAEKLRGYKPEEIRGMPPEKQVTPESLKLVFEVFSEEIPRVEADPGYNPIRTLDLEYYHKDGTTVWAESKFSVIRDESGKPVSILAEARDITERKQSEENLKRSEERFAAAFNINPDPTSLTVPETGKYVEVNPAFEKWSGYSREELLGRTSRGLSFWISPADRDTFLDRLSTHGTVEDMEITFRVKSGELRDTWFTARNVFIAGERYLLTRAHDVTERNRMLIALRESEAKYRMVVDNAQEAIFIAVDGIIIFSNRRATVLSGYSPEEIVSRPFIDFIHPDDRQIVAERYIKWLNGEDVPTTDIVRFIFKSGNIIWGELNVVSITWEGRPATLGFMTDITYRKRLEEEQQRVAKLESVGLLAGGIAHDFNNILTSILGNISLASMEAAPGSELRDSLEQAEKASQRAKDLTKQLLTFSKGGAPVTRLASLAELLKDTTSFALRGSNIICQFSIPADLWHAEIDAGQVSQVIQNLVINAQQAMPSGGTIEVTAENMALDITQNIGSGLPLKEGDYIRIAVSDHGSGIDAEHLDKIFDPFFTTKQTGSGLGLATAFSIARNHGGHLSVESKVGAGATFYLYLPASRETATPKQVKKEAGKPAGKARILVMDDEQGVREIAGRMLQHLGYQDVEFATDGADAIKLYKAAMKSGSPFTATILDLTIAGGMGGKETVRKLLKIDPGVKAIVSSGYVDDSVIAKHKDYGFSGMVAKPYTLEELRKALQDVAG